MTTPTKFDDLINSRDVIERIQELEAIVLPIHNVETGETEVDPNVSPEDRDGFAEELAIFTALAGEAGYAPDWEHGETLIRDSYFERYAETLAEDIGAIPASSAWPLYCIDWARAARELQQDYTSVNFDKVIYWVR